MNTDNPIYKNIYGSICVQIDYAEINKTHLHAIDIHFLDKNFQWFRQNDSIKIMNGEFFMDNFEQGGRIISPEFQKGYITIIPFDESIPPIELSSWNKNGLWITLIL